MPIYSYECKKCNLKKEVMRPANKRDARILCTSCKKTMNRIIDITNFHLKGTGWYKTDYGKQENEK